MKKTAGESLILVGGGGHCLSCIDVIEQHGIYRIEGIVDLPEMIHKRVAGYDVIASDNDIPELIAEYKNFMVTLGQIKSPEKRISIYDKISNLGGNFPVIISPNAYVSQHASIEKGTMVFHHALVNAGAKVGKNCIINTRSLIEHNAIIGNHCHISTGTIVNGGVIIGENSFVGSGTVCREYIEIGKGSCIGCNLKILKNVPANSIIKN